MTTRREKQKPPKPQQDKPIEATTTEGEKSIESPRKEKLADFLIDVAKYVFTGVIITSLFNDVSDKTVLYVVGVLIVIVALWIGLLLTSKRKDK